MDSRAKQRITGAVILVALFVLLVPELLTGPKGTDAPSDAPDDEGMRRYTIDLNASTPAAQAQNSPPQPTVVLPSIAQPGEEAVPAREPQPAPPAATTTPPAAAMTTPPAAAAKPPAAAPVVTAVAPPVERGNFVVQLGSFGTKENADRLVRDMTAKGFTAFVAPITSGGRELYRVRVGPTRDRAAAEALAAQLRRVGQSGSIVPIS